MRVSRGLSLFGVLFLCSVVQSFAKDIPFPKEFNLKDQEQCTLVYVQAFSGFLGSTAAVRLDCNEKNKPTTQILYSLGLDTFKDYKVFGITYLTHETDDRPEVTRLYHDLQKELLREGMKLVTNKDDFQAGYHADTVTEVYSF